MGNLKNEFSLGLPQNRWVSSDRLVIDRCDGGPGVPLIIRSPKLQKKASDPEGPKMGVPKIAPPPLFLDLWSLAHGRKMGRAKRNPHVCPLGVSCP